MVATEPPPSSTMGSFTPFTPSLDIKSQPGVFRRVTSVMATMATDDDGDSPWAHASHSTVWSRYSAA